MSATSARTVGLLAVLLLVAAPAAAQLGKYGTQVKLGDTDYANLLTKRASAAVRAMEADFGIPGQVSDNCILLMSDSTDGGTARAVAVGAPHPVYNKDIRMTPCQGKGVGTAIADADAVEQAATYTERAVEVRYADVNNNGKFDKGDPVYVGTMVGAARGLAASTATGAWTVRVTPAAGYAAGTFVMNGDRDLVMHGLTASGPAVPAGTRPDARTWSLAEREGNAWYLVPAAAGGLAAQSAIPVNSIRIGIAGTVQPQPSVQPTKIEFDPGARFEAEGEVGLTVKLANEGGHPGNGLLVVRLGEQLVAAALTPYLGAGETSSIHFKVALPEHGGPVTLAVNEMEVGLDVAGPLPDGEGADVQALLDRIAQLESRIGPLEAQVARLSQPAVTPQGEASRSSPSVAPVLVLLAALAAAALARRRA